MRPTGTPRRVQHGGPAARPEVGGEQDLGVGDDGGQIRHCRDGRRRMDAREEAGLAPVDVSDPRQLALVQQGDADRHVRGREQPAFGLGRVPVRAQQVRAEVPHDGVLLVGPDHLKDAQGEPDGVGRGGAQHAAGREAGLPPAAPGRVDLPAALHLQVRMDGEPVLRRRALHAHQQVLAAGHHLGHGPAAELQGGEARDPEVGRDQFLPGQGCVQLRGGAEDGIALRHGSSVPSGWSRPRRGRGRPPPGCPGCRGR